MVEAQDAENGGRASAAEARVEGALRVGFRHGLSDAEVLFSCQHPFLGLCGSRGGGRGGGLMWS